MKKDVAEFSLRLSENILELHQELVSKTYRHGSYRAFAISDPKPRKIHKALVRDRLLHHAIYLVLYPYFDRKFIFDSYSCRNFKGTHRPLERFKQFASQVSKNHKQTCWVLKCDVRKFFATIDQKVLMDVVRNHISDHNTLWLIERVIESFETAPGKGLPLGNLTSQLLVNVYMNEFDHYVKHKLKAKYYIRYADDFVFLSYDRNYLCTIYQHIVHFLNDRLKLELHPDKVFIKTFSSGVDFLGWVHFPKRRVLRTVTKRRMFKKVSTCQVDTLPVVHASYLGMLKHGDTYKLNLKLQKRNYF